MSGIIIGEFCIADELPQSAHDDVRDMYYQRALRSMSPLEVICARPVAWRPDGQALTRYGFLLPLPPAEKPRDVKTP